ncbi:SDR family NAD(P)-dependent oxidoreductase [Catellatospora coxensis]
MIDLSGRTALVSGSTQGIGYAIAEGLARCGAHVVVNGRGASTEEAAARLRSAVPDAPVTGVAADLATADGAAAMLDAMPNTPTPSSLTHPRRS